MSKILVISPHPDDETLGCGGTILKHRSIGDQIFLLFVTKMNAQNGWSAKKILQRDQEIKQISKIYKFKKIFNLNLDSAELDKYSKKNIIEKIGSVIKSIKAEIVYLPSINDSHTDHQIIAKSTHSCLKWFRYPSIKKAMAYEILSETNFNLSSRLNFSPNVFINITRFINEKIKIMKIYSSEMQSHPFPRSEQSIKSLAILRGSQSGFEYAEAFELLLSLHDKKI